MISLLGYTIMSSPLLPRWKWTGPVVLRGTCPVSEKFREEMNDWLIGMFGGKKEKSIIVDHVNRRIYANVQTAVELKRAVLESK